MNKMTTTYKSYSITPDPVKGEMFEFCKEGEEQCGIGTSIEDCERQIDEIEFNTTLDQLTTAFSLIAKQEGNRGKIECPKCEGDLHWSRASLNGHVWGKCKTENCLSWVQ